MSSKMMITRYWMHYSVNVDGHHLSPCTVPHPEIRESACRSDPALDAKDARPRGPVRHERWWA